VSAVDERDERNEHAIERVIRRYGSALDGRDIDGIVACFTNDAVLEYFGGDVVVEGTAAIRAFFDFGRRGGLPGLDAIVSSTHLWQVEDIVFDPSHRRAEVRTACVAHLLGRVGDDGVLVVRGITYLDELVHDDRWHIRRRQHLPRWESRMPATSPLLPGSEAAP
jgi:ketosteroid isomerase-like protein